MGQSKTSRYYATHPEAAAHRRKEQRKINKSPQKIAYRSSLNKANREAGTYGHMKAMGKDRSHTKSGKLVLESSSRNRARNGTRGRSTKK